MVSDTSKAGQPAPAIVWLRRDLRLADNPALAAALATGRPLILLFILETETNRSQQPGGASNWWLEKSLSRLSTEIQARGGDLILRRGDPDRILTGLLEESGFSHIFWNRRYTKPGRDKDAAIKKRLRDAGVHVESCNANLLTEPWSYKTGAGTYYKVFTPYWRRLQADYTPPAPLPAPDQLQTISLPSDKLEAWKLYTSMPDWAAAFSQNWIPGEDGAQAKLQNFLASPVSAYQDHRNRPDIETGTSGLSPHLAFGEISPALIWRATMDRINSGAADPDNALIFLSEIAWREFSYVLLFHNPDLAKENYNPSFAHMPWRDSQSDYQAWCEGRTGYPMVDAGMRQLWKTGWMHNRVRMICASFLTKHLLLPWQWGEKWFWDTLLDADPAANAASWQWTAGSGADAAPYFRVFNPITQGSKFDETGDYVRKYCPELAGLSTKFIHRPWEAPPLELAGAGVTIGETYPAPIVAHKAGRERALDAYDQMKKARDNDAG